MSNKHIDNLSDELDDVADQYEALGKGKGGWKKKFDAAWKKSFATKEFGSVKRRAVDFKNSNEGKMLKKEAHDLKMSIKKIHNSPPAKALKQAFMKWAHSKEVQHLKALDKKFLASPAGKKLMKEWHDFGVALKKHIKKDKNGIYIDNKHMDDIEDELDDVKDQYKKLEGSKWDKAYTAGWKAAIHSNEGKMLKKEVVELKNKIKQHLKITDLKDSDSSSDDEEDLAAKKKVAKKAKKAKKDNSSSDEEEEDLAAKKKVIKKKVAKKAKKDDSSSDEEEDLEEIEELLKITISKQGRKEIEKEWN